MPNNQAIIDFANEYGLTTVVLIVLVAAVVLLAKFWPNLVTFVTTVEVVRTLPEKLDGINDTIAAMRAEKSQRLQAVEKQIDLWKPVAVQREKDMAEIKDSLKDIRAELVTNHGSSLKDAVKGIEADVLMIKEALAIQA